MPRPAKGAKRAKSFSSQGSLNAAVKSICDIMRRSNCAGALQYVPELTWILFLRILDEQEEHEAEKAAAVRGDFRPALAAPYRWRDWAKSDGAKRKELEGAAIGAFFSFINGELIPHLKKLKARPNATPRQKVISEIMSGVDRTRIDTERNFKDILDKVGEISAFNVDPTHVFTLSQVYEGLLLKMGEKGNDGGQFFTPREIIRTIVEVIDPEPGKTVYDPCCGTGGFLAQAHEHIAGKLATRDATGPDFDFLRHRTFYGREKENLVYPITLANLMLHGIDEPHIWHGNTLTGEALYDGLFEQAPQKFDYILTNPPFGGKEGVGAQQRFDYKTSATQILFIQLIVSSLANGGKCGVVIDEGSLFRVDQEAFVKTKKRLLETCRLWAVLSLPASVFAGAGAAVKTSILFFEKGKPTEKIWYFDLADMKVGKKQPYTRERMRELGFYDLIKTLGDSERSWTVDFVAKRKAADTEAEELLAAAEPVKARAAALKAEFSVDKKKDAPDDARLGALADRLKATEREAREIENKAQAVRDAVYDLKAVNPNAKSNEDMRTPAELLDFIEAKGREVAAALAALRGRGP
jgi:type I restriction enzyme M protein